MANLVNWAGVVAMLVALVTFIVGQVMRAKAAMLLTKDQRNEVSTVRAMRGSARIILMCGVGLWLAVAIVAKLPLLSISVWVLLPVSAGVVVWAHVSYFRRLRALGLPSGYLRACYKARFIMYSGWVPVLGVVAYNSMKHA